MLKNLLDYYLSAQLHYGRPHWLGYMLFLSRLLNLAGNNHVSSRPLIISKLVTTVRGGHSIESTEKVNLPKESSPTDKYSKNETIVFVTLTLLSYLSQV